MKYKILKNLKYNGKVYATGEETDFAENDLTKSLEVDSVLEAVVEIEPEIKPEIAEPKVRKVKK